MISNRGFVVATTDVPILSRPHSLRTHQASAASPTCALELSIFDCSIRIDCADNHVVSLLLANYGQLRHPAKQALLHYRINRSRVSHGIVIDRDGAHPMIASDDAEFLYLFEKDITIELQKLRRDLYFLHSAALIFEKKAVLLVAPSGFGKSMTTWALLRHDFSYLSDELAPVDLDKMSVYPYPHAICLKTLPPPVYGLPDQTLYTSRTMHVPTACLPETILKEPVPLQAVFFLQRQPYAFIPSVKPVSRAEAAVRLFANALNPLAHKGDGLDGAVLIARRSVCLHLTVGELSSTCQLLKQTLR